MQGQGETPTALGMRGLKEQQEETEKRGERERRDARMFCFWNALPSLHAPNPRSFNPVSFCDRSDSSLHCVPRALVSRFLLGVVNTPLATGCHSALHPPVFSCAFG